MTEVYFTKEITSDSLIKIYEKLGISLKGAVAVKLHSGEAGNQNYLKPEFLKYTIDKVNGTVVECNTAYNGARNTTSKHEKLTEEHGWSKYYNVDIMDSTDPGKNHLIERIETRHGNHIIDASYKLNFSSCEYDLINID